MTLLQCAGELIIEGKLARGLSATPTCTLVCPRHKRAQPTYSSTPMHDTVHPHAHLCAWAKHGPGQLMEELQVVDQLVRHLQTKPAEFAEISGKPSSVCESSGFKLSSFHVDYTPIADDELLCGCY